MNPIFSRRYKAGSRPNIMPTSRRQAFTKSLSTNSGADSVPGSLSNSTSALATMNLNSESDGLPPMKTPLLRSTTVQSPSSEQPLGPPFPRKAKGHHQNQMDGKGTNSDARNASRELAQQLLASKQNMLAQSFLTPQENRQRAKLSSPHHQSMDKGEKGDVGGGGAMRQSVSTDNFMDGHGRGSNDAVVRSPTVHDIGGDMAFCDLEDDWQENSQTDYGGIQSGGKSPSSAASAYSSDFVRQQLNQSRISRPNLNQRISKEPLDMKTWRELRRVVCGTGSFHEGWTGQGFIFDSNIPFGLVQKNGGPCGVLAVVQSLLIRNLLFGSSFTKGEEKTTKLEDIRNFLESKPGEDECVNGGWEKIRKDRVQALVDAVAEILWICAQQRQQDDQKLSPGLEKHESTSIILFSDYRIQPETIRVSGRLELQHFLENSIHRFDCIALVYSAVLTRGISGVKTDMDFENCSLVGQHGYCSQELINLLTIGKAISNTFDHEIELDGKVLKGISGPCDVGLLSLFEHYDSIKVGRFLKCPRFPVWIICSESHFSVLFSCEMSLCDLNNGEGGTAEVVAGPITAFDLFYFDGLARQDKVIRLSIYFNRFHQSDCKTNEFNHAKNSFGSVASGMYGVGGGDDEEELVPPLEKCIRTKWNGAQVDWNDTEPIL